MTTMSISLPTPTAQAIDAEMKKLGFATRSEFLRAILRRYFSGELRFAEFKKKPLSQIRLELTNSGKYSDTFIESVIKGLAKSSVYAN